MREMGIYHGKTKDGEWVEGYFAKTILSNGELIYEIRDIEEEHRLACYTEVLPETVGEWTGLTDKNGKRIFEGDILERKLLPTKRMVFRFRIAFIPVKATFAAIDIDGSNVTFICDYINSNYETEIIGNIHDNPKLVKE